MTRPSESLGGTNLISSKNSLQISVSGSTPLYNIDSATNELPLSAIDFSSNPLTPESLIMDPLDAPPLTSSSAFSPHDPRPTISPLATNERPLSCTCLATISSCDNITNSINNKSINDDCCKPPSMLRVGKSPSLKINGKLCCKSRTHNTCYSLDDINHVSLIKSSSDSLDNQFHSSCSAPASFYCHENDNNAYCNSRETNSGKNYPMSMYSDNNNTLNSITYKEKSISDVIINQSLKNSCNMDSHSHTVNIINSNVSNINVDLIDTTSQSQFAFVDANTNASSTHNIPKINISNADASSISSSTVLTTISASSSCTETITVSNNPNTSSTNLYPITPCPQNDKLHDPDNTTSSASSSTSTSARRQRHGIAGQMSYFKMLGFGGFGKKMTTSTNSLFSTAVISGSSSAPNLRDMIPSTATQSGFGGVPPIRPLETLHNALSLKQLDQFLEKMTSAPLFKTPASSPPKYPSTPVPTPTQTTSQGSLQDRPPNFCSWSKQSSVSSVGNASSEIPSSPIASESCSRGYSSSEMSASLASTDGTNMLPRSEELSKYFPTLDEDLNSVCTQLVCEATDRRVDAEDNVENEDEKEILKEEESCLTPISVVPEPQLEISEKVQASASDAICDDEDEATISVDTCLPAPNEMEREASEKTIDKKEELQNQPSPGIAELNPFDLIKSENTSLHTSPKRNRVQKQISLYENELVSASEFKLVSHVAPKKLSIRNQKYSLVDANFLTQSASNDSIIIENAMRTKGDESHTKTKSCLNLKSYTMHHPGALLVKESFIDPPKRVARSFHGKLRYEANRENEKERQKLQTEGEAGTSSGLNSLKMRFITTKVNESQDNKK